MSTPISIQRFTVDSTMDMAADEFRVETLGAQEYLDASLIDTITLKAGYTDADTGTSYQVTALVGQVSEYGLTANPTLIRSTLRGRDHAAQLRERTYQMTYLRRKPSLSALAGASGAVYYLDVTVAPDGYIPAAVVNKLDQGRPTAYKVGQFYASQIALDVAASCGLRLQWECRDYLIVEEFAANGRPLDILKQLVEPWSQVPQFKVDVFVQGDAVICRPRDRLRPTDTELSVKDARIKSISIRKIYPKIYGLVTLEGKLVPAPITGAVSGGKFGDEVEEETLAETLDEFHTVLTKTKRLSTYRMPEKLLLRYHEWVWNKLQLTKEEIKTNDYEETLYGPNGPINQPRLLGSVTSVMGREEDDPDGKYQEVERQLTSFAYDEGGFETVTSVKKFHIRDQLLSSETKGTNQSSWAENYPEGPTWEEQMNGLSKQGLYEFRETLRKKYGDDGKGTTETVTITSMRGLIEDERTITTVKDIEYLKVETITTTYKLKTSDNLVSAYGPQVWIPVQVNMSTQAGLRPGGIRPGRGQSISAGGGVMPSSLVRLISTDAWADDVHYSNRNMAPEDLEIIMAQFEAASDEWEHEITVNYVAMPWLRKGHLLSLTDFADHNGTPIPLSPALVVSQNLQYSESRDRPEMGSQLRAVFWSA